MFWQVLQLMTTKWLE